MDRQQEGTAEPSEGPTGSITTLIPTERSLIGYQVLETELDAISTAGNLTTFTGSAATLFVSAAVSLFIAGYWQLGIGSTAIGLVFLAVAVWQYRTGRTLIGKIRSESKPRVNLIPPS